MSFPRKELNGVRNFKVDNEKVWIKTKKYVGIQDMESNRKNMTSSGAMAFALHSKSNECFIIIIIYIQNKSFGIINLEKIIININILLF